MKHYRIDPARVSLDEFQELTAAKDMLPARIMLQEQLEKRFQLLKKAGIRDLGRLLSVLSTKKKIGEIAGHTGLPATYLELLKREAGSYLARPRPLSDFPGIPFEYVELLKSRGLRNTRDFFENVQTDKQQMELSRASGIPQYRLAELHVLSDLTRITGVGGIFARVLYEAGLRSPAEFAQDEAAGLLARCRKVMAKHGYDSGNPGEKDMQYGIHYANFLLAYDQKSDSHEP